MSPHLRIEALSRQAASLRDLRSFLFRKTEIAGNGPVLLLGRGIGEATAELQSISGEFIVGLDSEAEAQYFTEAEQPRSVIQSKSQTKAIEPHASFVLSSMTRLPFKDGMFGAVCAQYWFMFCPDPVKALLEINRVVKPGGLIIAMAEPDFGGRIDEPDLRQAPLYSAALAMEGIDPCIGRKLPKIFRQAGFKPEIGVWNLLVEGPVLSEAEGSSITFENLWDSFFTVVQPVASKADLIRMKKSWKRQAEAGLSLTHLPIFWAVAKK